MSKIIPPEMVLNQTVGDAMYALMGELYPICRSITGDGVLAHAGHVAAANSFADP